MPEWTRHGECGHCGHCCEMFARVPMVRGLDVPDRAFYEARGFTIREIDETPYLARWGWVSAPCPQHVEQRCRIHASRPETCAAFPVRPQDIVGTPCTYWFESERGCVGGLGSPHPTTEWGLMAVEA